MANETLDEIEKDIYDEMIGLIGFAMKLNGPIDKVQPPSSVIILAAKAATAVIMAFERGLRIGG
ncbi:MAG: hypothetical protein ABSG01_09055 [Anaerolineales bacterium]|jgi:hypothetical protein